MRQGDHLSGLFAATRGHPPLISASYRDSILSWHGDGGLKALLMQFEGDSATVETGDEGILLDMDTPEDYERLQEVAAQGNDPFTAGLRAASE